MSLDQNLNGRAFLAAMAALTLGPGIWTIAHAPTTGLGADVLSGSVQRLYETRFEASFPQRDALRHAWAALKYGAFNEVADGAISSQDGTLFTAEEFNPPSTPRDFAAALATAQARIANAGGELIPVIVPDKARMMPDALPQDRSAYFDARYMRLTQIIAQQGLRSVDLRFALSEPGSYMVTDTHWSPDGAKAAAAQLARLLANDLARDTAFETIETGTRPFEGDLLAFADTGAWRPVVGPAPERISTFETTSPASGALGLFGDVETPVALVGTSFSARDDFHFVGFLKSALGADVLSFAMEGRGPFVPMDLFLEGSALSDASPQYVIWEIPERYLDTWSQDQ